MKAYFERVALNVKDVVTTSTESTAPTSSWCGGNETIVLSVPCEGPVEEE